MVYDKLKIIAFKDDGYSLPTNTVVVPINPASYKHQHKVGYNDRIALGASGTTLKFRGVQPEVISFDIYFDATGAIEFCILPIGPLLTQFKSACYSYNGSIHEPNYLIISWGSLVFKCKLTSLDVNYTLFQKNGIPLRAKASAQFKQALSESQITRTANNQSPDLTHMIVVREGDTLPLLCKEMYGDSSYYLEVAQYNDIMNFRNLVPGTKIYLPPLKS